MKPCHRILAFGIAALLPCVAGGATLTWDTVSGTAGAQGGTGSWLAASRWLQGSTNVTWISGSDAIFGGTAGTVTLTADTAVGNMTFNSGYTLVGNGTSELELSSTVATTITVASGVTATIDVQMEYADTVPVLNKEGTGTLVLSDLLDGGSGTNEPALLVKAGTVRLDPGFSTRGKLNVSSGATLNVNGTVSVGSFGGPGNVVLNGELQLPVIDSDDNTLSGNITGTGSLLLGATGGAGVQLTLTGNNSLADVRVRGGRLRLGSANALSANADVVLDGGEIDLFGFDRSIASLSGQDTGVFEPRFALGAATLTVGTSGTSTTYEGFFTGTGTLRKAGTGRLLLSSVSNSNNLFTGTIRVEAGTIAVPAVADSGAASPLSVATTLELGTGNSVGELEFTGTGVDSTNRGIVLIGPGGGAIDVSSATGSLTWSGVISGSGGFRKRGAGELILSGVNTLTGAVDVTAGRLRVGGASALASAPSVTLTNAAGVELALDVSATIRSLAGGGSSGGNVVLATRTLTIDQDVNTTFAGVISGTSTAGLGAINKAGTGTLTLTGANSFTQDLRIQEGVVAVAAIGATNAANPLGQGPVQLGSATTRGTLRYSGPSATFARSMSTFAGGGEINVQLAATRLDFTGTFGGSGVVVKTGAGEFAPSGLLSFTGNLAIEGGTWEASTWVNAGGLSRIGAGSAVSLGDAAGGLGRLRFTGPTGSSDRTVSIIGEGEVEITNAGTVFTLSAGLAGTGVQLRKAGLGMLVLSGDSSFSGTMRVINGPLRLANVNAIDSVSDIVIVNSAGTHLDLADVPGGSYVIPNLSGNAPTGNGLGMNAENATLLQTTTTSFLGTISGTNASGTLTKGGPGTITLLGSNTFAQAIHIAEGTLAVNSSNAPANPGNLGAASTITFGAASTGGTLSVTSGFATNNSRTLTINAGGGTISISNAAGTLTQSGAISGAISGAGPFAKAGAGTLVLSADNSFSGPTNVQAGTLTIGNAGALDQSSLVTVGSGATLALSTDASLLAIDGSGTVALASSALTLIGGANATFGGVMTGTAGGKSFTKRGGGTLTLTNTANSFSQNVVIEDGALSIASLGDSGENSALGSGFAITLGALGTQGSLAYAGPTDQSNRPFILNFGGGVVEVVNAATQLTVNGDISGLGNFVKSGAGRLQLQGANTWGGNVLIQAGELIVRSIGDVGAPSNLGSGNLIALAPAAQLTFLGEGGQPGTTNRLVTLSGGGAIQTSAELNLRSGVSGTGELRKLGAEKLIVSGTSGFNGTVSIENGSLVLAKNDALSATESVDFDGPAKLELTTSSELKKIVSGTAPGTISLGTFALTLRVPNGGTPAQFAGPIDGQGTLVKAGAGPLTLTSTASTFTGGVEVRQGALSFGDVKNAGQSSSLGSGGAITLGEGSTSGALDFLGVNASTNRAFVIGGTGGILTISAAGGGLTLSGGISGSADLTKNGAGRLTIAGSNAFTGRLQVAQGVLRLDGALNAGPGSLDINPGATLTGGGTANRPVSIQGTFTPIGLFTTGALSLQTASTLRLNFASPSSFDRVSAIGAVTMTGTANLALTLEYDPLDFSDNFVVLLNDGSDAVSGRFTVAGNILDQGEVFAAAGQQWEIRYNGGDGNDVALFAVPEASTSLLLLGGIFASSAARRRRRLESNPEAANVAA